MTDTIAIHTMNNVESNFRRRTQTIARIGVFGVGYYKYWDQFPGLLEELKKKQEVLIGMVKQEQVEVIDFGLIDNVKSAYELITALQAGNLDLIMCDMLTYATSSTFGIIIKSIDTPIVLVALQPHEALDYANASTYQQLYIIMLFPKRKTLSRLCY